MLPNRSCYYFQYAIGRTDLPSCFVLFCFFLANQPVVNTDCLCAVQSMNGCVCVCKCIRRCHKTGWIILYVAWFRLAKMDMHEGAGWLTTLYVALLSRPLTLAHTHIMWEQYAKSSTLKEKPYLNVWLLFFLCLVRGFRAFTKKKHPATTKRSHANMILTNIRAGAIESSSCNSLWTEMR